MECKLNTKNIEELRPTDIMPQTPFWGRVKEKQGFHTAGFEITVSKDLLFSTGNSWKHNCDDMLVLIRYIDQDHCYAYVPYGPKLEPDFENQGIFLEDLSETLRVHLPSNCMFIRYDLAWENQWVEDDDYFDQNGNWIGPPENNIQEMRVNYKTSNWNLRKSPCDMLPKNTFFIDLKPNEDQLLGNMRYNTRYNIRKAIKNGVITREYGLEMIPQWYALYLETALRHGLPLQSEQFFSSILTNQDNEKKGVKVKLLMSGLEDRFLSGLFLVLSNRRGVYLYGASLPGKQNMMASYALQWEAMKLAREHGCTEYDMFGSAPNTYEDHPFHGVHIYKKGFGGHLFHRMGCWDYPFDLEQYEVFVTQEMKAF